MSAAQAKNPQVLVVDDNDELRTALRDLLESGGFDVVATADGGEAAIEQARSHKPDVVLMDIKMPGIDGIDATRRITTEVPETTVVAHTAYDDAGLVIDTVRAGAKGYLLKGIDAAQLFDGLRSAASGSACISKAAARSLFDEVEKSADREQRRVLETEELAAAVADRVRADPLTGLLTWRHFRDEAESRLAAMQRPGDYVTLVVVRIADLEALNRVQGWDTGDALLATAGRVICDVLRPGAAGGRLDGNELALVVADADHEEASAIAAALASSIHSAAISDAIELRTGIGLVVAEFGEQTGPAGAHADADDVDSLIVAAREAARTATAHPSGKRVVTASSHAASGPGRR